MRTQRSMLDSIAEEANDLQRVLGARDRGGSANISTTCARSSGASSGPKAQQHLAGDALDAPVGVPDSFEEHVGLMFDLLAAAFQADMTRVFTFMLSRELSQRTYPQIWRHRAASLGLAPSATIADKMAQNVKINTYHMELFAKFLEKLRRHRGRRRVAARPLR